MVFLISSSKFSVPPPSHRFTGGVPGSECVYSCTIKSKFKPAPLLNKCYFQLGLCLDNGLDSSDWVELNIASEGTAP